MNKRNQLEIAEVNESTHEKVFYLPRRPVIRESTETTKVGIFMMPQPSLTKIL